MIILAGGIGLVLLVIGVIIYCSSNEDAGAGFCGAGGVLAVIAIVASLFAGGDVVDSRYIDEKIAMYTAENEEIESDIQGVVEAYKDYEGKTFADIANKSPISLVTLFPELKSDTLVAKQIDVYVSNNDNIKKLKIKAINYKSSKWWLYFGG